MIQYDQFPADGVSSSELIYLSSPYYHNDPAVRFERVTAATSAVTNLIRIGLKVYSPIVHNHKTAEALRTLDPLTDWWKRTWRDFDFFMLGRCDVVFVLDIGGIRESRGVREEFAYATQNQKRVYVLDPPKGPESVSFKKIFPMDMGQEILPYEQFSS